MPKELEFPVSATINGKTYEGQRVVKVKSKSATQYITCFNPIHTITDSMTYQYPSEEDKMEWVGKIIFAELLGKFGIQ
jgi:hypothetical protein